MAKVEITITDASHDLFMAFAEDAPNWGGTPPTGGNVGMTNAERGNLTQLKRAGLVTTTDADGQTWVDFTPLGKHYAKVNGITV